MNPYFFLVAMSMPWLLFYPV